MKTSTSPRLTCRLVRGWVSVCGSASAGAPRGLGAGHVATCPDCQHFFRACDELDLALKRDAARHAPVPPAGLEQRIMRAVNQSAPEPRAPRYVPLALAGAVACAALAVLVFQQRSSPTNVTVPDVPALAANQVWTSLKPSADALLAGDPLQREVDAVVSDARSAVRFLQRNFLPSAPEPQGRRG
jgi:anti-sigma factor RsiW